MARKDLEALLVRARRYPVDETVIRVGDELHVINPRAETIPGAPRLHVHVVAAKVPAIRTLTSAVAEWDNAQIEADPFMWRTIEALGDNSDDYLALLYARVVIVRASTIAAVAPPPLVDSWNALEHVLGNDPPPSRLKLKNRSLAMSTSPEWATRAVARCEPKDRDVLLLSPSPFAYVVVDRADEICIVSNVDDRYARTGVVVGKQQLQETAWIDGFEALLTHDDYPSGVPPVTSKPFELDAFWSEADHQLALLWLALRKIKTSACVRRADGALIACIAPGLGVEVIATRSKAALDPIAMITIGGGEDRYNRDKLTHAIPVGIEGYREIRAHVPRSVIVHHEHVRFEINVIGSSLFGGPVMPAAADGEDDESSDDD